MMDLIYGLTIFPIHFSVFDTESSVYFLSLKSSAPEMPDDPCDARRRR